ncbi:toxin-antitoxin system YwqK family antitoxin [Lacinutrix mariniflava]|uniref:toxin-antitoxin system YwqK family antitoxin n=1 Tax=Lacinutrix mariniflava TaxID=342955 RepID=UPI0006E3C952|nr:hypothetical protein [Lacinutrix mariniflava]
MKKSILFSIAFLMAVVTFAQEKRDLKLNEDTNLIEVVYYHDNGVVSQTGAYTADGKLQGEWLSYNTQGKKQVSANYDNGKKVGKWLIWKDATLKEVDYNNNAITSVSDWKVKSPVADNN